MSLPMKNIVNPIPIIVGGKSLYVAIGVKEGIRPAYEAIHVVNSVEAGVRDIPSLLQGHAPPSKDWANLGTQKYGKNAAAVVTGGGYNDADFEQPRRACEGKGSVPWLRHDISRDIDPRQPRPKVGIEYGEHIAKKIVDCLQGLAKDDKMDVGGVYWF